jgi:hypothetical protein
MVRVAPDKHAWCPAPGEKMPEYVICRWSKSADGLCRPIPVPMNMARVTADLLVLLGFGGTHRKQTFHTLRRLATAGFVEMVHVSPGVWMLDLDSWFRHVAECVDNPDRWEEGGEDLRSYKFANGLGGWKK